MTLRDRFVEGALLLGMTVEEASRAADDALDRQAWRVRRGGKECSSCGEAKPLSSFGLDSTRRDGHSYRCKICERERDRRR